jgi:hypothetical protein
VINFLPVYTALYARFGQAATITPTVGAPISVTLIDKTHGQEVQDTKTGVATVIPAALVRAPELTARGVTRAQLRKAVVALNGKTWRVENTVPKPAPTGEADGEYLLHLSEGA